jgi:hypothetical protein
VYQKPLFTEFAMHGNELILSLEKEGARWCRWSSKLAEVFFIKPMKTPI